MGYGATANDRIGGYTKSEVIESKWLLLAIAPACPLVLIDLLGWGHNSIWWAAVWLSGAWFLVIAGTMFVPMFRALKRSLRRRR
jgi:hypothetical protein